MREPAHSQARTLALPLWLAERALKARAPQLHDEVEPLFGLRRARECAGLTLADLAIETGLPASLIGRLEAALDPPSPSTRTRLAAALGVAVEALVTPPAAMPWLGAHVR